MPAAKKKKPNVSNAPKEKQEIIPTKTSKKQIEETPESEKSESEEELTFANDQGLEDGDGDEDENANLRSSSGSDENGESDEDGEDEDYGIDNQLLQEVQNSAGPTFYSDSEEEEWDDNTKNRVGHIPMKFYDDYDHIGYNLEGKQVLRPKTADEVDKVLAKEDDPNFWRTVRDVVGQRDVVLSSEEYNLVSSLVKGQYPLGYDPYQPFEDFYYPDAGFPILNLPPRKDDFRPLSKWERVKIRKLVHAIKKGWIKVGEEEKPKKKEKTYFNIWDEQLEDETKKKRETLPAPKINLPIHSESYNPPPEFLLTDEEKAQLETLDLVDRVIDYVPQKFDSLRKVPAYPELVKERFTRCLDLFLAPRMKVAPKTLQSPSELLPKLQDPETLKPFPTIQSIVYEGHTGKVRSICTDPTGQWLLSGSDDKTARIWEISTGRCVKVYKLSGVVYNVAWNPDPSKCILAISVDEEVILVDHELGNEENEQQTAELLSKSVESKDEKSACEWSKASEELRKQGVFYSIRHERSVKQLNWHHKGDYLLAVAPDASNKNTCIVHQLTTRKSQSPFKKQKGQIQYAMFHPSKPLLFVATQIHIKKYNLAQLRLEQKLLSGVKWISCFDIHPGGDNLIMGSYDKRVSWFDTDLSTMPYKILRYHKLAVRKVTYHKRYPLFASCSDDLNVHVFHGMVYSDLLQNAYIQPLKVLRGHKLVDGLGVLDVTFHPSQPWLFSAGADSTIRLFT